jgi:signal transduction histidine kinase
MLAALMGVVMLGLIFVQAYWINNAVELKEKQFSQLVLRALQSVSHDIESREAAFHVFNDFFPGVSEGDPDSSGNFQFKLNFDSRGGFWQEGEEQSFHLDQQVIISQSPQGKTQSSLRITIENDSVMMVLPGENGLDTFRLPNNPGIIRIPEPVEIQKKIISKKRQVDRVMSQILSPRMPVEERLDADQLKQSLDRTFRNIGIDIPYEFAVVRHTADFAMKSKAFNPDKNSKVYTTQLFAQDIFTSPNFLRVYFPGERNFIYRSVGVMGIASILMTSIIILIFILTLWVILRQKRLSEIKNDFVNNMTHELKTPISTISLASQMLNDRSIPAEQKNLGHISRIIETESKRLGYQVEKVLQMAIFDKGKLKLNQKVLDLNQLAASGAENFKLQVEKRGGRIEWVPGALNPQVRVDEVHFTNVISNLLDNALKYSSNEPDIHISTRDEKQYVVLSVADHGIGIAPDDQKRIFEKFYRVPTGNIHNVKGFGLGLSYVKKIVEVHGGFIQLRSELNKGSRFDIYLPKAES